MANNIFQKSIVPIKPRILMEERVFVYTPKATTNSEGIASFNNLDFGVNNGRVSLIWPMKTEIEQLSDPLSEVSRVKVLSDEFLNTGMASTITNPVTGTTYSSTSAEIKFNRQNRNALDRPDFVMLNTNDFVPSVEAGDYVKYTLKQNNPLEQPSLVKLSTADFDYENIATVNWPLASSKDTRLDGFGLMRLSDDQSNYLTYDESGNTVFDTEKLDDAIHYTSKVKPTYGGTASTGFTNISSFIDPLTGIALRGTDESILLSITKESVGLSKVENKAFSDYEYDDFGTSLQNTLNRKFVKEADWNAKFADWNPPTVAKDTPQKWLSALEEEDESLWSTLKTIRLFVGYFDNLNALTALYPANAITYGSTAFLTNFRSYWGVRTSNVNQMFDTDAQAKSYIPPKDENGKYIFDIYVTGSRATDNRFQWNSTSKVYIPYGTPGDALYLDYYLGNDEELAPFIEENRDSLKVGESIGIRETDNIFIWDGTNANLSTRKVYYEWYNTGVTNMSFMDFVEKQASAFLPNGTPSAGSSGLWAQSNHVHPYDLTRLASDTYKSTKVTINSEFDNNATSDFNFNFWEQDEQGQYIPNRMVNIPYVRKGQTTHNWRGQTTFADTATSDVHYWGGTAEQFTGEQNTIPNSSIIMVDDNEDFITTSFLSDTSLKLQGITIDSYNTNERFVISDQTKIDSLVGVPITVEKYTNLEGNQRIKISTALPGITDSERLIVTRSTNGNVTIGQMPIPESFLVVGKVNQTVGASTFRTENLMRTQDGSGIVKLPVGQILVSKNDNGVGTIDFGNVANQMIGTNGLGSIKTMSFVNEGTLVAIGPNNTVSQSNFLSDNILVTNATTLETRILPAGKVLMSSAGNEVTTVDIGTTLADKLVVSNTIGGIKSLTLTSNKLVYGNNNGQVASFPMNAGDVGKFIGVSSDGAPTLLPPPSHPTTLPVTTYTTNPGTNINGLVISKLSSDPGNYSEGVLYLW